MRLTVQHMMEATVTVAAIIRDHRPMPQRGKYLLARMHAKLLPEFTVANERRSALIKEYGEPSLDEVFEGWRVIPAREQEFQDAWAPVAATQIEVDVSPIPLSALDLGPNANGGVEADELAALGSLVGE